MRQFFSIHDVNPFYDGINCFDDWPKPDDLSRIVGGDEIQTWNSTHGITFTFVVCCAIFERKGFHCVCIDSEGIDYLDPKPGDVVCVEWHQIKYISSIGKELQRMGSVVEYGNVIELATFRKKRE